MYSKNESLVMPSKPYLIQLPTTSSIASIDWFINFINTNNITNKQLRTVCIEANEIQKNIFQHGEYKTNYTNYQSFFDFESKIFGIKFLTQCLKQFYEPKYFDRYKKHIHNRKNLLQTYPIINSNMYRDWLWEICIASLLKPHVTNITLDEPDITCIFKEMNVGIAAKILYSDNFSGRLTEQIIKGLDQCNKNKKIKFDMKIVCINLVEQFPVKGNFYREYASSDISKLQIESIFHRWQHSNIDSDSIIKAIKTRINVPTGIIFFVPHLFMFNNRAAPYYEFYSFIEVDTPNNSRPYELTKLLLESGNNIITNSMNN